MKQFATIKEAYTKLQHVSNVETESTIKGGVNRFATKKEIVATGKADESLLSKYGSNDFVLLDDIVKVETIYLGVIKCYITAAVRNTYPTGDRDIGYHIGGNTGSLSEITNTTGRIPAIYVNMYEGFRDRDYPGTYRPDFVINAHLRSLIPNIYNAVDVKVYGVNNELLVDWKCTIAHSNTDFNYPVVTNATRQEVKALFESNIGKRFTWEFSFYKI